MQDSIQLSTCLWASLSNKGKSKVNMHRADYCIGDRRVGAMLLKVIICESHIDTNATVSRIRTQLSSLDTYLPTIGHNICKMNDFVTSLHDALMARGETSNDLFGNLFKGYKAAFDRHFIAYIEKKEEDYEDGSLSITPQQLMTLAKNRYEVLVEKGLWNAPSAEEEKILALKATVKRLQNTNRSNKKASGASNDSRSEDKKPKDKERNTHPAWMDKEPKPGKPRLLMAKHGTTVSTMESGLATPPTTARRYVKGIFLTP